MSKTTALTVHREHVRFDEDRSVRYRNENVDLDEHNLLDDNCVKDDVLNVKCNEYNILDVDCDRDDVLNVKCNEYNILDVDCDILDVDYDRDDILDVDYDRDDFLDEKYNEYDILEVACDRMEYEDFLNEYLPSDTRLSPEPTSRVEPTSRAEPTSRVNAGTENDNIFDFNDTNNHNFTAYAEYDNKIIKRDREKFCIENVKNNETNTYCAASSSAASVSPITSAEAGIVQYVENSTNMEISNTNTGIIHIKSSNNGRCSGVNSSSCSNTITKNDKYTTTSNNNNKSEKYGLARCDRNSNKINDKINKNNVKKPKKWKNNKNMCFGATMATATSTSGSEEATEAAQSTIFKKTTKTTKTTKNTTNNDDTSTNCYESFPNASSSSVRGSSVVYFHKEQQPVEQQSTVASRTASCDTDKQQALNQRNSANQAQNSVIKQRKQRSNRGKQQRRRLQQQRNLNGGNMDVELVANQLKNIIISTDKTPATNTYIPQFSSYRIAKNRLIIKLTKNNNSTQLSTSGEESDDDDDTAAGQVTQCVDKVKNSDNEVVEDWLNNNNVKKIEKMDSEDSDVTTTDCCENGENDTEFSENSTHNKRQNSLNSNEFDLLNVQNSKMVNRHLTELIKNGQMEDEEEDDDEEFFEECQKIEKVCKESGQIFSYENGYKEITELRNYLRNTFNYIEGKMVKIPAMGYWLFTPNFLRGELLARIKRVSTQYAYTSSLCRSGISNEELHSNHVIMENWKRYVNKRFLNDMFVRINFPHDEFLVLTQANFKCYGRRHPECIAPISLAVAHCRIVQNPNYPHISHLRVLSISNCHLLSELGRGRSKIFGNFEYVMGRKNKHLPIYICYPVGLSNIYYTNMYSFSQMLSEHTIYNFSTCIEYDDTIHRVDCILNKDNSHSKVCCFCKLLTCLTNFAGRAVNVPYAEPIVYNSYEYSDFF